ncbi:MAG: FkbM family methyltransferase [Ruminococcus sp.]|nr:FkbM family methyltransferase [Ruminococcus sp.]
MLTDKLKELPFWADRLKESGLPVYIYGMGDGCEKLLSAFEKHGVTCSGIFVSDDFKRDKVFRGFRLQGMTELEQSVDEFAAACAFGTSLPEVMARIDGLAQRHLLVFPETAVVGEVFFDKDTLLDRAGDTEKVYSLLSDDRSRQVFEDVLSFRITGDLGYLKEYDEPEDIYALLELNGDEIYADLGAYTGDTVESFLAYTGGKYRRIYAVEPGKKNFEKCQKRCEGLGNCELINAAVSDCDGTAFFTKGSGRQQMLSDSGIPVEKRSLDSILAGRECSFIKYDVEGEDIPALLGSRETIVHYSPKIRTGIYHRPYDILDIPLLLHEMQPDYRLYMRRARYYPAWDTEAVAKV